MNLSLQVYHVLMHQAHEGGYWCEILEVPGCVAQGETEAECLQNLRNMRDTLVTFLDSETRTGYGGEQEEKP